MSVDSYQDVSLELGAIIKLVSETNSIYHNKYFLIDYLDMIVTNATVKLSSLLIVKLK